MKQQDAIFSLHMRTTVFCQQFNVNERIWGITLNALDKHVKSGMHIDRERTPIAKDVIGNFPFNT